MNSVVDNFEIQGPAAQNRLSADGTHNTTDRCFHDLLTSIGLTSTQIIPIGEVVELANQPQGNGFDPAIADAGTDPDKDSPERSALEGGAYGELMRRAKEQPLGFTFTWRGTDFKGTVENIGEDMRLSLRSDLASIPYSAENAAARGDLLAVVDTCAGNSEAKLMVFQGRTVMLEHEIALPEALDDTMANLITQLTILVLNTAPYLDLIADYTSGQAKD